MKTISLLIIGCVLALLVLLSVPPSSIKAAKLTNQITALLSFVLIVLAVTLSIMVLSYKEPPPIFIPQNSFQS